LLQRPMHSETKKFLADMRQAQGEVAAEHAMTLYKDVVQRLLRSTEGYECQEAEGNFMLVFHRPMRAVQFCLQVDNLAYRWTALLTGRQLPFITGQFCLQVDIAAKLVRTSMIDAACNLPLWHIAMLDKAECLLGLSCPTGMLGGRARKDFADCFCVASDTHYRPRRVC